ncbi:MAG: MalY/PatB family protein [Oscillospiraceae bacterium]
MYDFDTPAPRAGNMSIKWDLRGRAYHNENALPFWIADSDYMSAPEIIDALKEAVEKCMFGYAKPDDPYLNAVIGWFSRRHGWDIDKSWIMPTTGIVSEIANIIRCFTSPGDGIIVQTPVYDPFSKCVANAGRRLIENPLKGDNLSGYEMDLEDLERDLKSGAKMLLLCSPHNPVGRVWSREEITAAAGLCEKHGALLVSDEIHCDILLNGTKHFTAGLACTPDNVIVLTSPGKTFNMAGLKNANAVIPNPSLKSRLEAWHEQYSIEKPNNLGLAACRAAYERGDKWCDEQNIYLSENAQVVIDFLREKLPQVTAAELQGTYLMWLDMRASGATSSQLTNSIAAAGACLNDGSRYGKRCDGFMRLNIACPRSQLIKGLDAVYTGFLAVCK